jgi:hypothetical protein
MKLILFIFSFLSLNSIAQLTPYNTFSELPDPKPVNSNSWHNTPKGAHSGFVSDNETFDRSAAPASNQVKNTWKKKAWRGERIHTQALIFSTRPLADIRLEVSDLKNLSGNKISKEFVQANFVRYVLTDLPGDLKSGCGLNKILDTTLHADMIDNVSQFSTAAFTSRPVWLTINVPQKTTPGIYKGTLTIKSKDYTSSLSYFIEVLNHTLPPPKEWKFHLDLWQNPFSDARVYGVEPWSDKHFQIMKSNYKMLSNAGQKVITATIIDDPWNSQTYDVYGSMVKWTKQKDGNWKYDYSVFDKWIEFMMSLGIDKQIDCYSMIPWNLKFRYFDEATGKKEVLIAKPESEAYKNHWENMLKNFARHLKEKGWFNITTIAMDERPEKDMKAAIEIIKTADPDFKISMAGNYHPDIQSSLVDYSLSSNQHIPPEVLAERKNMSFKTTFYTACPEIFPNTFTSCEYADATWLAWHALNKNLDGYLRWAYNCWNKDPLRDSRYGSWLAGDTYLVYPGARSSIRFERLREGIQDFEKFTILREYLKKSGEVEKLKQLESVLNLFQLDSLNGNNAHIAVDKAQNVLNSL